jgi:DNA polymerase III subunit epsilon
MDPSLSFPLALERPLAFFDLETTGLRIAADRIIELALIRLTPSGDVSEKVRRFNPGVPIPPEATAVHGISDEDVADKPPFAARARSLAELLEPCDLAGFNLRRFDLPMLLAEFGRAGVPFSVEDRRIIDVQMIFHREEPRDLSAAVRFYLGREMEDAHSALADIRATAAVLGAQLERYPHLPRDMDGLDRYCDEVRPFETEVDRWFDRDDEGALSFRRGKHQGRELKTVAGAHPDYLEWMLGLDDLDESVKDVVREALSGPAPGRG